MLNTKNQAQSKSKGMAKVAVWKDNSIDRRMQGLFSMSPEGTFFDFSKPLQVLDSSQWSSQIKMETQESFFCFSINN